MVPLGRDATSHFGIPFLPITDEGETEMPPQLQKLCERLSQGRALAYIEAEFFGGAGTQACVLFNDGRPVDQPIVSETAISHALHILGVSKENAYDEFEAVGLGKHRDTESWLDVEYAHT